MTTKASETVVHIVKSYLPSMQFLLKSGKAVQFRDHKAYIRDQAELEELQAEIAAGNPSMYIDDKEEQTTQAALEDPLIELKEKLRAEIEAEIAAAASKQTEVKQAEVKAPTSGAGIVSTAKLATAASSNK